MGSSVSIPKKTMALPVVEGGSNLSRSLPGATTILAEKCSVVMAEGVTVKSTVTSVLSTEKMGVPVHFLLEVVLTGKKILYPCL